MIVYYVEQENHNTDDRYMYGIFDKLQPIIDSLNNGKHKFYTHSYNVCEYNTTTQIGEWIHRYCWFDGRLIIRAVQEEKAPL